MDHSLNLILETANNECKQGNFKQGIHLYSQYIQAKPSDPKAHYQRGKAYFQIKDYNAAVSDLNKALSMAPNDPHLIGERGLIYFMAKKEALALADFDRAIELDSNNPFRYASRAFIKDQLNDLPGAKEDYQKALEIDPEDAISYNNLGMVLEKMGRKNKADQHFERAAELDPKNFGMNSANMKGDLSAEAPQPLDQKPSPIEDQKSKTVSQSKNFKDTLVSLLTSKEERKAFWQFVKEKL